MDWNKIAPMIREIIGEIKDKCIIDNAAIRDDIFNILEDNCTVIYFPLEDEKNRGFHVKRIVNDELEDFVYINTAKPMAEQIFTAAHEFGHIFSVANKVWNKLGYEGNPTTDQEEDITNLFAAELLMPVEDFKKSFFRHMEELELDPRKVRLEDLIRVIVMQMNMFMVPYESVRKRLIETGLIGQTIAEFLLEKEKDILRIVEILCEDQNTYLGKGTGIKTISGVRALIESAEIQGKGDKYLVRKLKKDLDMDDMNIVDSMEIEIEVSGYDEERSDC